MSGHSKWNNIKRKKEKTDGARAKVFTKIGREIAIAVREGGSNPDVNGKLRDVIAKAKANNMPNDNIPAPSRRRRASWAMWITSRSPTKAMPPAAWP